jgi:hypothetical protein
MNIPEGWKAALTAEMDRRFGICRVYGPLDDEALCNDDTQAGVEFAMNFIDALTK